MEFPFSLTDSERRGRTHPVEFPLNSAKSDTRGRLRALANAAHAFPRQLLTPQTPNLQTRTLLLRIRE